MRKLYTLKWPSTSAPLCRRTPACCLRRTHTLFTLFTPHTQISRSPAQSVLGSGMGSLSDLLIAFQVNDSERFVRLFVLSKGAYNLQSSNQYPLWTADVPSPLFQSLFLFIFLSLFSFCSVPFYLFVSYLFLLLVLQRHFMPTISRPFPPPAHSSISMPPLGIVLLRSEEGEEVGGGGVRGREQNFCRTCQQLDAIINWKRCPAHVACSMGHQRVCAVSLSPSLSLSLSFSLLFCSHLPPVDCHLSLLFRPIDGFQNVFWHVRAVCVAFPLPLCPIPLLPSVCLFLCFLTLTLSAATRRISVKSRKISWLLRLRPSSSRQQATQSRRCHMWSQYANASKLFVVPHAVASVHNSVNYFRQFDSSLSLSVNTRRTIQLNMENKWSSPMSRRNSSKWNGFQLTLEICIIWMKLCHVSIKFNRNYSLYLSLFCISSKILVKG